MSRSSSAYLADICPDTFEILQQSFLDLADSPNVKRRYQAEEGILRHEILGTFDDCALDEGLAVRLDELSLVAIRQNVTGCIQQTNDAQVDIRVGFSYELDKNAENVTGYIIASTVKMNEVSGSIHGEQRLLLPDSEAIGRNYKYDDYRLAKNDYGRLILRGVVSSSQTTMSAGDCLEVASRLDGFAKRNI